MGKNIYSLEVRFTAALVAAVLFIGPSGARASVEICRSLPELTQSAVTDTQIEKCVEAVEGKTLDLMAALVCRNLNSYVKKGADAESINRCFGSIVGRRFNYTKLRRCKVTRPTADAVLKCVRTSAV
jgi:hypothetical protein